MASSIYQRRFQWAADGSLEVVWEIPVEHQAKAFDARSHDGMVKFFYDRSEDGSLNPCLDHSGEVPPSVHQEIDLRFKESHAAYAQQLLHDRHAITSELDEIAKRALDTGGEQNSEDFERYEQLTDALKENVAEYYRLNVILCWEAWPYAQLTQLEMSYSVYSVTGFPQCRPDIYVSYQLPKMSLELYGADGSWDPHTVITWSRAIRHAVFEVKDGVRVDNDIAQLRAFKQFLQAGTEINVIMTERAWQERKYFRPHAARLLLWDPEIGLLEEVL